MMATTTGTTRATTTGSGWCASDSDAAGPFSFRELWRAYGACRRRKRSTRDAQRYDQHLLDHLVATQQALVEGEWRPHRAQWFVSVRPKVREVHCAPFADRVVHHWLVPRLGAVYERVFIHDSHSNRAGHGTHYAVDRLQKHLRSASANGRHPAWYLQLDIRNFFNCVDRRLLYRLIRDRLSRDVASGRVPAVEGRAVLWLTGRILAQEPAEAACYMGDPARRERVPAHKRLAETPPGIGLAVGNLPSQLFANIYLNERLQHIKPRLWNETDTAVHLDLPASTRESARATLASYLGHFRHARAWRLSQRVFANHPWLKSLFILREGLQLQPRWQPPAVIGLRSQWQWFRRQWSEAVVLIQVGRDCEVYEADVACLQRHGAGPTPADQPRPPFQNSARLPLKRLRGLRRRLRMLGVAHVFVAEEGFLPGGLKRRVLRLGWWPRQSELSV